MRLVRTSARYAGGPPPGIPGWLDDETAEFLIERGLAVDCSSLARREGRPETEPEAWSDHTTDELVVLAEHLGVPGVGPRHLLIERIEAAQASGPVT